MKVYGSDLGAWGHGLGFNPKPKPTLTFLFASTHKVLVNEAHSRVDENDKFLINQRDKPQLDVREEAQIPDTSLLKEHSHCRTCLVTVCETPTRSSKHPTSHMLLCSVHMTLARRTTSTTLLQFPQPHLNPRFKVRGTCKHRCESYRPYDNSLHRHCELPSTSP